MTTKRDNPLSIWRMLTERVGLWIQVEREGDGLADLTEECRRQVSQMTSKEVLGE